MTIPLSQPDLAKLRIVYERLAALGRQARLGKGGKPDEDILNAKDILDQIEKETCEVVPSGKELTSLPAILTT